VRNTRSGRQWRETAGSWAYLDALDGCQCFRHGFRARVGGQEHGQLDFSRHLRSGLPQRAIRVMHAYQR
jgi:hypothetical protein